LHSKEALFMTSTRYFAALVLAGLTVAGCGGGDPPAVSPTVAAPAENPPPAVDPADTDILLS
jgi:hypothetical protein